jgi:hypothetical protein
MYKHVGEQSEITIYLQQANITCFSLYLVFITDFDQELVAMASETQGQMQHWH